MKAFGLKSEQWVLLQVKSMELSTQNILRNAEYTDESALVPNALYRNYKVLSHKETRVLRNSIAFVTGHPSKYYHSNSVWLSSGVRSVETTSLEVELRNTV